MYIRGAAHKNKRANDNKHNKTIAKAAKLAGFHLDKTFLFQTHAWQMGYEWEPGPSRL